MKSFQTTMLPNSDLHKFISLLDGAVDSVPVTLQGYESRLMNRITEQILPSGMLALDITIFQDRAEDSFLSILNRIEELEATHLYIFIEDQCLYFIFSKPAEKFVLDPRMLPLGRED